MYTGKYKGNYAYTVLASKLAMAMEYSCLVSHCGKLPECRSSAGSKIKELLGKGK